MKNDYVLKVLMNLRKDVEWSSQITGNYLPLFEMDLLIKKWRRK